MITGKLDTHDLFDLIDTETNQTPRIYGSITEARIDCRFLNAHATVLSQWAKEIRGREKIGRSDVAERSVAPLAQLTRPALRPSKRCRPVRPAGQASATGRPCTGQTTIKEDRFMSNNNSRDMYQTTNRAKSNRRCFYCDTPIADRWDEQEECFLVSCSSEVAVPVTLMHFPVHTPPCEGPLRCQ